MSYVSPHTEGVWKPPHLYRKRHFQLTGQMISTEIQNKHCVTKSYILITTIISYILQAYPSMKPLASWTRDLVLRVEQFEKWATTAHQPMVFWLSAFTFPTGFLTAVLQTSARQNNVSVNIQHLIVIQHSLGICISYKIAMNYVIIND